MPNDIGGGLGHVRRTTHLANLLRKRDWETGFIIHRESTRRHISPDHTCFHVPIDLEKYYVGLRSLQSPIHFRAEAMSLTSVLKAPFFWEFASLNYQALRDGYFDHFIIRRRLKKISRIISKWKPDLLIGDGHLLTCFLGKMYSIPTIQVVRYFVFPESPHFIWWKDAAPELIAPDTTPVFAQLLQNSDAKLWEEASRYLSGDAYLIPGTSEIEPVLTESPHLFYGYYREGENGAGSPPSKETKNPPQIFVTIGAGAHRTRVDLLYETIYTTFFNSPYRVIISDPMNLLSGRETREGMEVHPWVDTSAVYPETDLVVHHGGYGTTMETLRWGIPSLILPSHSEQEGNGRRLEFLNSGKVMLPAETPYQPVKFLFHTGEFTMLGGFKFLLTSDRIISTIEQVLADKNFKVSAARQAENLRTAYNPEQISEFVRRIADT